MDTVDHLNRLPPVPAKHREKWTEDDMLSLSSFYLAEISWQDIATKLGRTTCACKHRLYIIRLACTLFSNTEAKEILSLLSK